RFSWRRSWQWRYLRSRRKLNIFLIPGQGVDKRLFPVISQHFAHEFFVADPELLKRAALFDNIELIRPGFTFDFHDVKSCLVLHA
ncbi:MAG: hypothetical protein LLG02_09925, partial [Pelosinus sp.]|nr:hypothetical protein [Pelosinus sp.]